MKTRPPEPDAGATRLEDFLTAGIVDLCRLVRLPDLRDFCPASQYFGQASTTAGTPVSPAVAQLAIYILLVTRGLQPRHKTLYPRRDRLQSLLQRVYRKAVKAWDEGDFNNVHELQPAVRPLAAFARRNIPGFQGMGAGLDSFGVKSVKVSLAILTEKLAMSFARQIAKNPAKTFAELLGASIVASAPWPGVIEKLGRRHTVRGLMRLGVSAGLAGTPSSRTGKQAVMLDDLQKFLKRANKVLQRSD